MAARLPAPEPKPVRDRPGTVPPVPRLLAHHIQELIDTGNLKDLAEVARRGHVSGARGAQIMNLLLLGPRCWGCDPVRARVTEGRGHLAERSVRTVIAGPSFGKQRDVWGGIKQEAGLV